MPGISVRTVYKWLRRFRLEGNFGLADRSSRPRHSPTQLQLESAHIVLELRRNEAMTAAKIAASCFFYRKRPHAGCGALTPMKKLERAAWTTS